MWTNARTHVEHTRSHTQPQWGLLLQLRTNRTSSQRSNVKQTGWMFTVKLYLNSVHTFGCKGHGCLWQQHHKQHCVDTRFVWVAAFTEGCFLWIQEDVKRGRGWNEEIMEKKKKHSNLMFSLWSTYDLRILLFFHAVNLCCTHPINDKTKLMSRTIILHCCPCNT